MKDIDSFLSNIFCENNLETMRRMPTESVDCAITSPPYDELRKYNGYSFDFKAISQSLFRILKPGGIIVWVVGDQTINGSETGTSFRQALGFMEAGFRLHDTMIYNRFSPFPETNRYHPSFEYMFVLSKGRPKTANLIRDHESVNFRNGVTTRIATARQADGRLVAERHNITQQFVVRSNIWRINAGNMVSTKDKVAYEHPAIFPEKLVRDHMHTWTNETDIVYDPFMGSGTVAKVAHQMNRRWIGSEISEEYVDVAMRRIKPYIDQYNLYS